MSSADRRPYLTATVLNQSFLNYCQDNLTNQLELIVDIETPTAEIIHASNRNKYVGGVFYEALLEFPVITRTIGDWLQPQIEFGQLELELANADGRFSRYVPGGDDFDGWIGKSVEVKLGLRDVASTYFTIFKGRVSDVGGFGRTLSSIKILARDEFDDLRRSFPQIVFTPTDFPDIEPGNIGLGIPIIYGDWTSAVTERLGSVPAFVVNGINDAVRGEDDLGSPVPRTIDVDCVVSINANQSLDTSEVYLKRGDTTYQFAAADIHNVNGTFNRFDIKQGATGGVTVVDGGPYEFRTGDQFYVKVIGKSLGVHSDNIIAIAYDILTVEGGVSLSAVDTPQWEALRDKASIASVSARAWIQEAVPIIEYVLSLLEQVRVEMFQDRALKLTLRALHFDEFDASPSHTLRLWDIEKDTFTPQIEQLTNFNRAQGEYNLLPDLGQQAFQTGVWRNQAAITQAGKDIYKRIVFPNLYVKADVEVNLQEILKLASAYIERIECTVTWRSLLQDIGDFVSIDVVIGATVMDNVPCLIRQIGYSPDGIKLPMVLWSFQMCPFPGYNPGYPGTVGGSSAVLTEET